MTQYRVSWNMWIPSWSKPYLTVHIYDNEEEARDQVKGLMALLAPHLPRTCATHVWDVKLEVRKVDEWKIVS